MNSHPFLKKNFEHLIASLFFIFCGSFSVIAQNAFITTWATSNSGSSNSSQITIPAVGAYSFYWEAENDSSVNGNGEASGAYTLDFPEPGIYEVQLTPTDGNHPFNQIKFDSEGDYKKLISIDQWGDVEWASFNNAYTETTNLVINASDAPDLNKVTDMSFAFFNSGIGNEGNLNAWNVSSVVNMEAVFFGTQNFNQSLADWNTTHVEILKGMFAGNHIYNQPIQTWDVSQVTDMSFMFQDAQEFNQSLNEWDVSHVEDMSYMFSNALVFNGEIDQWDVSNVTNMEGMFTLAYGFNQPLNSWDVQNVTNFSTMFTGTVLFNQPLDNWDVHNAETLWGMFSSSAFNQNLGNWDVSSATDLSQMLDESGISCENYSLTLIGWADNPDLQENVSLGANELTYSPAANEARAYLMDSLGWTILGDQEGNCELGIGKIEKTRLRVYPNPTNGIVHIESELNLDKIEVFDMTGKLLLSADELSLKGGQIDLTEFPKGVYFIILKIGNARESQKIIVE